ncbi:oligosaccharide flippase family protein, partial [candidate division WWE3 bacterium]|nr:oligosaccharide flippase family protein [candidate division WWE3 bacterium]
MDPIIRLISKGLRTDGRYFLSGGFWLLIAQASTIAASLITAVFFAHYLSENIYGTYKYIIGLSAILTAFSLTGLPQAILQATAKGYQNFLLSSLPITIKYSFGIFLTSLTLAGYYYLNGNATLAIGCVMIAILHPATNLFSNISSYQTGLAQFRTVSNLHTIKSIAVSGASLAALYVTKDLLVLLFVYFLAQALVSVLSYFLLKPTKADTTVIPAKVWVSHIRYAKHTSLRTVLSKIANGLDSIVIFQYLGAAELALFSIATLIPNQIKSSFKNLQTLLLPKYSRHESLETLRQSIPVRSFQFLAILLTATLLFLYFVPLLYEVLFPKYPEAIPYAQLLALAFPASVFHIPMGALMAQKAERSLYQFDIVTSIIQILSLIALTYFFGLLG